VASLVGGFVLMLGFDRPATRIAGVACLLVFLVAGLSSSRTPRSSREDR
jgi:hypothetical protein